MNERELFEAALDISDADERRRFLDRACAGDESLRRDVEDLLRCHAGAVPCVESPAFHAEHGLAAEGVPEPTDAPGTLPDDDPLTGLEFQGITLLRPIGEGGFGRVYEGRQSRPRRSVAVKVLRAPFATAQLARRFEYEA